MKLRLFLILLLTIYFIINCSTPHSDDEKDSISVNDILINQVTNKVPVENSNQKDLDLLAVVNEENFKRNSEYNWHVEYLKLDIDNKNSTTDSFNTYQTKEDLLNDKYLEGYYFLETSKKNPLNAILSIYKDGFYKVTLKVINDNDIKEYSVIIKIGEPVLPNLFVKVNVPKMNNLSANDYIGKFYLKISSDNKSNNSNIIELNANEIKDNWLDTGIVINPFESLKINAGTHILNDATQSISSIVNNNDLNEYDSIGYRLNNEEFNYVTLTPLIIKGENYKNFIINKLGSKSWLKGSVYISFLMWQEDNTNYDKFIYYKKELNKNITKISINLNNIYLSKIFIGSFGHRVPFNNYYIFFGPEGTNLDELDPKNTREYPGLPYGFLLGKLGVNGTVFPISNQFNYEIEQILKVLSF